MHVQCSSRGFCTVLQTIPALPTPPTTCTASVLLCYRSADHIRCCSRNPQLDPSGTWSEQGQSQSLWGPSNACCRPRHMPIAVRAAIHVATTPRTSSGASSDTRHDVLGTTCRSQQGQRRWSSCLPWLSPWPLSPAHPTACAPKRPSGVTHSSASAVNPPIMTMPPTGAPLPYVLSPWRLTK